MPNLLDLGLQLVIFPQHFIRQVLDKIQLHQEKYANGCQKTIKQNYPPYPSIPEQKHKVTRSFPLRIRILFNSDKKLISVSPKIQSTPLMMRITTNAKWYQSTIKHFVDTKYTNVTAIAEDAPGALAKLCSTFAKNNVNLSYLRTHCLDHKKGEKRSYRLQISYQKDDHFNFQKAKAELQQQRIKITEAKPIRVPWFPQNMQDVDKIGKLLLQVNESKDHPQFQDIQYRKRRDFIAKVAKQYKMGDEIPNVEYTPQENELWSNIYTKLNRLHQNSMSQRFLRHSRELNKELKLDQRVPQLRELSEYLHSRTGFKIKPTHGILSQRQFLNAFAFKIFCSTQYLRNVKNPDYTPEPDIVHEFVGHVPMFADPAVAEISHRIGLLSLGASDEQISKLGTLYWFTLQFGVCKQGGKNLGYGAGIASSIGEIEHMMSGVPKFQKLDIFRDCTAPYPVQTVQPIYRVTESFEQSLSDLQNYGRSIMKPITTVYNEATEQIEYDRSIEGIHTEDAGPKF